MQFTSVSIPCALVQVCGYASVKYLEIRYAISKSVTEKWEENQKTMEKGKCG